ncbi:hypothetical protein QR680_014999 [Steinernema hermaphroditum]|uniref:CHK kinase-like domain-containing protein n=1 Tax=Steinernema hermaphroditum TaxID=289476 RepID=A0AA39ICY6_9BILA|nr:hypothetical protein QR680_014999 [Steinernema hermaphroditum]
MATATAGCSLYSVLIQLDDQTCSIQKQWLIASLKNHAEFQSKLEVYPIENISLTNITGGKGTISAVYRCVISFKDIEETIEVVLKVSDPNKTLPAFDRTDESSAPKTKAIVGFHEAECDFYEHYAPNLDFPVPQVYGALRCVDATGPGVIIMESFCEKADTVTLAAGFNQYQLFNIAKHLALFHKHFLCLRSEEWRGKHDSSTNVVKRLVNTDFFSTNLEKLRLLKPGQFNHGINRFLPYGKLAKFIKFGLQDAYKEAGLPSVLVHGDFWCNNILWRKNPDGSLSNEIAVVVDWQLFDEGSPIRDITRALVMCMDADIRREYQYDILQCYYDTLLKLMQEEGQKLEFTFEQIVRAYKGSFIYQAMLIMCLGPYLSSFESQSDVRNKAILLFRREKFLLRALFAMDEALEMLPEFPLEKFAD